MIPIPVQILPVPSSRPEQSDPRGMHAGPMENWVGFVFGREIVIWNAKNIAPA